jgi:5-(carboxyamino)imidazole ribonucleotide synthase
MGPRIGIYGGGQLGAYLCQAANSMGLSTSVLAVTKDSMAIGFADHCLVAPPSDLAAVRALLACTDILTFEREDVPQAVLEEIERWASAGDIDVAPSVQVMRLLQDKYLQKQWLQTEGIPTAQFVSCSEETSMASLVEALGLPFVQKAHRGGYDGKGVQLITDPSGEAKLWRANAFAERFIEDKREISMLVARSMTGEIRCYPVIEMLFDSAGHVLEQAHAPAGITDAIAQRSRLMAEQIVERLQGVGVFAIEMFLTADDGLLVNEISPRVHNTGHLTIEAHATSQYEQHLRAITGKPLGGVAQRAPAVMRNILYTDQLAVMRRLDCGRTAWNGSTNVHWYGKEGGKMLRKMGHVTATGQDVADAARRADAALAALAEVHGEAV